MKSTHKLAALTAIIALPAAAENPVPTGMLPRTVVPSEYRLDLTIAPDQPRFSGHTEIDVTLKSSTSLIWIHGRGLEVQRVVAQAGGKTITGTYTQRHDEGVASLNFEQPLSAGKATLAFDYDAPFMNGAFGLYHVKVGDAWYAWTQFETTDARRVFPGFDEPGFKTPYTVKLRTPKGLTALTNGPDNAVKSEGGLDVHSFHTTKPLPTYLIAFGVGPFAGLAGSAPPTPQRKEPLPLRLFATAQFQDRLADPLKRTPAYIGALEAFFDSPYPYEKLDQLASPAMQGGMENAGLITYDNVSLLFGHEGSLRLQQRFATLLAHEIGHHWFGNLVSPAWWTDSWLNESFANWIGYRIGHQVEPTIGLDARPLRDGVGAMKTDSLTAGRAVHVKATNTIIDAALDGLTYGKGSQVIGMIESFMGPQVFQAAVRTYLQRHAHGNATTDDFFAALAEVGKQPQIVTAMRSFIDQQGVPVLDVTEAGNVLKIRQSRYRPLASPVAPQTRWTIPFCYRDSSGRQCVMMSSEEISVPNRGELFVANAGGQGYWRFNLPKARWDRLIAEGRELPMGEALLALDSLWSAVEVGKASPAQLVAATRSFARHANADVAIESARRWMEWQSQGVISTAALADSRRLLGEVYKPILDELQLDLRSGAYRSETPARRQLRNDTVNILADGARDATVRKALNKAAEAFLVGKTSALDGEFMESALQVHAQEGSLANAQALRDRALSTEDALFRDNALRALGTSGRAEVAEFVLQGLTDPRLRERERTLLISRLVATRETRSLALAWLKRTVAAGRFVPDVVSSMRASSLENACSAEDLAAVEAIMTPKVMGGERGLIHLNRSLETMRNCARLKSANAGDIAAALN